MKLEMQILQVAENIKYLRNKFEVARRWKSQTNFTSAVLCSFTKREKVPGVDAVLDLAAFLSGSCQILSCGWRKIHQ